MGKVDYSIIFWGVRGSLPAPGPDTVEFGGNTACVQVQIGERLLILDAGSGIYKLGQHLLQKGSGASGDIFITHTHWDHIQGFPFFAPAFIKDNHFTLYGQGNMDQNFADLMRGQMIHPHFPVLLHEMGAGIEFFEITAGEQISLGNGITVKTIHNNHPNGGTSYRIEHQGRVCCYVTDTEHSPRIDPGLKKFVERADVVIYDSNFTDEEYNGYPGFPAKKGWGHSTWQEGIKLVQAAGAHKLVLFHHAIHRTDKDMVEIERQAQARYSNCKAAREGMVISL